MDGVAVAAGAGVNADVFAFFCGKFCEDFVVEVDECFEQIGACPGVAGIFFGGQTPFTTV